MAKSEQHTIKTSLSILLQYNNILSKKRSYLAEKEISNAINEERNIIKLIPKIKEIDEKYNIEERFNQDEGQNRKPEVKLKPLLPIKKEIKKSSFFVYLFKERKKLVHLCKKNPLITPRFFGLSYKINKQTFILLDEIKNKAVLNIMPFLLNILQTAWEVLPPEEYNVFYFIYNFLNNYVNNYNFVNKDINNMRRFMDSFADDFLTLTQKKKYFEEIKASSYAFFGSSKKKEEVDFLNFMEKILEKKSSFTLYNFLLLYYSIFYKKVLPVDTLIRDKGIEHIPTDKYLVNQRIKSIVEKRLIGLKKQQEDNDKNLFHLKHILDDNLFILEDFIFEENKVKFPIINYKNDLIETTTNFIHALTKYANPILKEKLKLEKDSVIQENYIFSTIWEPTLGFLENFTNNIESDKKIHKYVALPLPIFQKYQEVKKLTSEREEKTCQFIEKIFNELYYIFETMNQFIYNDYLLTYKENSQMVLDKLHTRVIPITEKFEQRFIPYNDFKLEIYKNKTVLDVLIRLTSIVGTFLYAIEHPILKDKIKHKNSFIEENKRNIEKIIKISFYFDKM